MILITITEVILYICFSILFGALLLALVPETKKPPVYIPQRLQILAAALIPVAAFMPVFDVARTLGAGMDLNFILQSVLFSFEIGQAWMLILIISLVMMIVLLGKNLSDNKQLNFWALLLALFMLLAYTKSSHAATISDWGFLWHTLHFLGVSVWIGILLMVSWFAKNKENWSTFLKWFTPLALTCLFVVIVSGYFTMSIDIASYDDPNASVVQEYSDSLIVNYGQALFLKHLFIISLIMFAVFNGILFRKKSEVDSFNPFKWARAESVYALIVFGLTAFMGQSWPPHQLYSLINTEGPSPLFQAIYDGEMITTIQNAGQTGIFHVAMSFGLESYLLFAMSILFLAVMIFAAVKRHSIFAASFASLLMMLAVYFGVILGVQ